MKLYVFRVAANGRSRKVQSTSAYLSPCLTGQVARVERIVYGTCLLRPLYETVESRSVVMRHMSFKDV
jgi:hypothetical protein